MGEPPLLRMQVSEDQRDAWVVALVAEVAAERGWRVDEGGAERPDALAIIGPDDGAVPAVDEPALVVQVEAGTPRSPAVVESAAHLIPRFELVVGAFRARRNQQVTRAAMERFLERVTDERPATLDPNVVPDPAEAVAGSDGTAIVAENRALLDAVDAWLARTTMTPAAAQAIAADRAILAAAIGAPVIDLVIVERAATRLAQVIEDPSPDRGCDGSCSRTAPHTSRI